MQIILFSSVWLLANVALGKSGLSLYTKFLCSTCHGHKPGQPPAVPMYPSLWGGDRGCLEREFSNIVKGFRKGSLVIAMRAQVADMDKGTSKISKDDLKLLLDYVASQKKIDHKPAGNVSRCQ